MYIEKLRLNQLIEIEKKLKSRHDEIHYYENSISVCQHVSKERCRLIVLLSLWGIIAYQLTSQLLSESDGYLFLLRSF